MFAIEFDAADAAIARVAQKVDIAAR